MALYIKHDRLRQGSTDILNPHGKMRGIDKVGSTMVLRDGFKASSSSSATEGFVSRGKSAGWGRRRSRWTHTDLNPKIFASGTNYINNGSASSSLTSDYGSYSLHKTVWDYKQSGNIYTFTVGSNAEGSLRFRATADPDNAPRSNSGNDRTLRLRKNGSNIKSVGASAYRNAVLDFTTTVAAGDVFILYMDNASDWRDLGGFERIISIYITGA